MSARWRLRKQHYLNIMTPEGEHEGEWEYREEPRFAKGVKGRRPRISRVRFPVPTLLDPDDTFQHNDNAIEGIIVTNAFDPAHPGDWIFVGDPTPDMDPINEEAEAISKSMAKKWVNPIESLPANSDFSQSLITAFEGQMRELQKIVPAQPVSAGQVSKDEFEELKANMAKLMEQNAALIAQQLEAGSPGRRSV